MQNAITDVDHILVGHAQNIEALTGCTVILCPEGATGGVDQRGGAPGTRETDLMRPMHLVDKVHAVVLSGGSAFGLDAASGVMRYLEEQGVGFDAGVARVPIVAGAVLFDLGIGSAQIRPDAAMGYQASLNASSAPPAQGNVGAGTGATVGKAAGMGRAMKAGIGTASVDVGGGLIVGAIVAVNAMGDVVAPDTGQILAGTRAPEGAPSPLAGTLETMRASLAARSAGFADLQNTVIGVVATNAALTKEETNKVAQMAQDGLAMTVRPAHTLFDGDTFFALATGTVRADVSLVGAYAAQVVASAIVQAVLHARPAAGLPSASSLIPSPPGQPGG